MAFDFPYFRWRITVTVLVILLVGVPLAMPFFTLLSYPEGWRVWTEPSRILPLAANSLQLMIGTLAISLPIGIFGGMLLYRTDLPGKQLFRSFSIFSLFIPLPLVLSGWQAAWGADGLLPGVLGRRAEHWQPWMIGIWPAIWIHTMAAIPWVIWIVGRGLCTVERELEEDGLTFAKPWQVLFQITLRRCRPTLLLAGFWVIVPLATEITITDILVVRTFAEEVYTQIVGYDRLGVVRSVAECLPFMTVFGLMFGFVWVRYGIDFPVVDTRRADPLLFSLGWSRWPLFVGVFIVLLLLAGIPLAGLFWKAGQIGYPAHWTSEMFWFQVSRVFTRYWTWIIYNLALALLSGAIVTTIAILVCWLARGSILLRIGAVILMITAWMIPGPLVGLGMKETIFQIINVSHSTLLTRILYEGPSPIPCLWSLVVRFLPFGMAIVWPVVNRIPREIWENGLLDGASPGKTLRWIVIPLTRPGLILAGMAVAILSLGELGASKLVQTPGRTRMFAHEIFEQMHYGVGNEVAAMCLVLLGLVAVGTGIMAWLPSLWQMGLTWIGGLNRVEWSGERN